MTKRPEKGENAPSITLPTGDETNVSLNHPRGKGHILFFYPKDNTKGCTTEAKDFSALKAQFLERGYDIFGISKDSLRSHQNFINKQELTIELASDVDGEACEAFGVWVEKQMYGKTYMGIERSTFIVEADGSISALWRKVKVKGHAQAVLDHISQTTA